MFNLTATVIKKQMTLAVSTLLVCFAAQARSQSNLIQDPGFEANGSLAPHWTADGNPTAAGVDTTAAHAHSGNNSAYIFDDNNSGRFIDLSQKVTVAANTSYTLTGYVDASNTTGGIFGVRTQGGSNIATISFVNTDAGPSTHGSSDYHPYKVTFNSGGNTSVVVFAGYTASGSGSFINLDDVTLPSPSGSAPPADPASAQTIFDCSSFTSSGNCSVATGTSSRFTLNGNGPPSMSGSKVLLMPSGAQHQADSVIWNASAVNVQAFTSSFTFVPNGWNLAFVLQNNTNIYAGPKGSSFSAGAGCEGAFWQAFDSANPPYPTNIFTLNLDSTNLMNASSSSFTYSSAQIYSTGQNPCIPNDGAPNYTAIGKVSTAPVSLNSPAAVGNTTTGDTYSATISYNGNDLTLDLYDVTTGGSCPGSNCFAYTWSGVNIPSVVGGDTAWVGLTSATNQASSDPLYVKSFSYTVQ